MKTHLFRMILTAMLTAILITLLSLSLTANAANAKTDYDFSGIYLTRDSVKLKIGGSILLATREIGQLEGKKVFSSADEEVATVASDGTVIAKKLGETVVTVSKGSYHDTVKVIVTDDDPSHENYRHTAELYRDFLDLRFGMFLHFNSSTYEFADIGGDWAGQDRTSTFDPKSWNPSDMDCREWAKIAKSAGMTFAVLTTKHHDGFDLWDSAYTDYDVGSATYKNDVVKEFTDACREEGIKPALYFSMLDIKHKITSSSCNATDIEFIKAQLTELLTNYGEIPFIIFDAWNAWWGGPNYSLLPYDEIVNLVHTLQPNCLVINISCEANNVRSEVAMFESAAGQQVPEWFDNINISCNTPTSHWFWCTKYQNETFKTADWVMNENLHKFRDSDTVFILNCSPNQKGVLINKYKTLFAEIGKRYQKTEDVAVFPQHYLADYAYTNNLLFHKRAWAMTTDGNSAAERAVDGYCDFDAAHETAYLSPNGYAAWAADIGYTAELGKCYLHLSNKMSKDTLNHAYLYVLKDDPGKVFTYKKLDGMEYLKKVKLSELESFENCLIADCSGISGRYLAVALEKAGVLSLSEVVLTPADINDKTSYSLREKFAEESYTIGSALALPETGIFVTGEGFLVRETITWENKTVDKTGKVTFKGRSESGCEVEITVKVFKAASSEEVPAKSVVASSMWSQAESLGWAHSRNLIDKSGLTINPNNIALSMHDNPYNGTSMWHTLEGERTGWLVFDLGAIKRVTAVVIWNHNQLNEADRGVKKLAIYYSEKADPSEGDWILVGNYQLTRAGCVETQTATDTLSLGELSARKIKFEILENYGDPSVVGLSEVIFFAEETSSELELSEANKALSSFDAMNAFEYDKAVFDAAKTAYLALMQGKNEAKNQAELDALTNTLNQKIDLAKATYQKKIPKNLGAYMLVLKKGESLPATLKVTFTDNTTADLPIVWDTLPHHKEATVGCYLASGMLEYSTYAVTASVKVEGVSSASLAGIVKDYETLSLDRYTDESATVFKTALASAKDVLTESDVTQAEIDGAKAVLTAAKYALKIDYRKNPVKDPDITDAPNSDIPSAPDTPTSSDTPISGDQNGSSGGSLIWLYIVPGILAVLTIGGAVVFIIMKKKG